MAAEPVGASCPRCGEPLEADATVCLRCGAVVDGSALRAFARTLKPRPPSPTPPDASDDGWLYLCPSCGAFVAGSDETCARCGVALSHEAEDLEAFVEGTGLCPFCREEVAPGADPCPSCGRSLTAASAQPGGLCVLCGAVLPRGATRCGVCGTPATAAAFESRSTASAGCPSCGAAVAADSVVCSVCGVTFEDEPQIAEDSETPDLPGPGPAASEDVSEPGSAVPKLKGSVVSTGRESPGLRTGTSAPVPAHRPVKRAVRPVARRAAAARSRKRPLVSFEEAVVYLTAAALPGAYLATVLDSPPVKWSLVAVFAALFGAAFSLVWYRQRAAPLHGRAVALSVLATLALAAIPIVALLGAAVPEVVHPVLAAVGLLAGLASAGPDLRGPRSLLPWAGATLPLTLLSFASAVPLALDPLGSAGAWTSATILVGVSAVAVGRSHIARLRVGHRLADAIVAVGDRDLAASLRAYDRAIDIATRGGELDDAPYYAKGATLILLGRYEEALEATDRALEINPRNTVAHVNRGNALARMGRSLEALKAFNAAIKVEPGYEVAWNNKGNVLTRMGNYREALACYDRALEIDPAYRGAWANKGYALTRLGDYAAAAVCAERLVQLGRRPRPGVG